MVLTPTVDRALGVIVDLTEKFVDHEPPECIAFVPDHFREGTEVLSVLR